jgi:uncharacterized repeat protein (TIGR02543 family)
MKKRILASLMALCLIAGLLPATALAAEEPQQDVVSTVVTGEPSEVPTVPPTEEQEEPEVPVCAGLEGCVNGTHDPQCPLYVEPEPPMEKLIPAEPVTEDTEADKEAEADMAPLAEDGMSGTCGAEGSNVTWALTVNNNDTSNPTYNLTISGSGAMEDFTAGSAEPPWFEKREDITNITLSDELTTIGQRAFYGTTSLTSVNIPESVISIGAQAFHSAPVVTEIPAGVQKIGITAFYGNFTVTVDEKSPYFEAENGVLYTKGKTEVVQAPSSIEGNYMVPSAVTAIRAYAFTGANSLKNVNFSQAIHLTSIGTTAFGSCSDLTSLTFPEEFVDGLSIGYYAFGNSNLSGILTLPVGVKSIDAHAFRDNKHLTEVNMSAGMEEIKDYAFYNCSSLKDVALSDTLQTIGTNIFQNTALAKIVIPASVTKIKDRAFYNLKCLETVEFPENMTGTLEIGARAFSDTGISGPLVLPEGLSKIGSYAFCNVESVTDLTLPSSSLKEIGDSAFYNNTSLRSVTVRGKSGNRIPGTVSSIGASAFAFCNKLADTLYIEPGVSKIGKEAFYDHKGMALSVVYLPSTIRQVGQRAFHSLDGDDDNIKDGSGKAIIYCADDSVFDLMTQNDHYSARTTALANLKGGVIDDFNNNTNKGDLITSPRKTGYDFAGWHEQSSENTEHTLVTEITTHPTGDWAVRYPYPYIAVWNSTITFDGNGGSGSMEDQVICETDTTTPLTKNSFTRDGYEFAGWNTKADGTGTAYNDEETGVGKDGSITLYAQWTKKIGESTSYTVNAIQDHVYTGAAIEPAVVVKSGETVLNGGYTVSYINNTNVGMAKVTVTIGKDSAEVTFNITKDNNPTVEMSDVSVTYGTNYEMTATAKTHAGNEITGGTITIKYYTNEACSEGESETAPTDAGIYYAKATLTETGNYAEASTAAKITINNAGFSVTAQGYDGVYDGQPHSITVTAEGAAVTYSTDGINYNTENPTFTDAGEYTVYYKATKANHNDVTGSVIVKIAKATPAIAISADSTELRGGGTVTLTVDTSKLPMGAAVSVSCGNTSYNPTLGTDGNYTVTLPNSDGTYTFTVAYAGDNNHNNVSATCTVTVSRRSSGGGSGSSGSSGDYAVSVDAGKHGSVTVSPKRADKGDTITLTVKPDKGYELDQLTVTDKSGDRVKLKDKGNGKFTFTMPTSKVLVEASFKLIETEPEAPVFADVPADAYYADAVAWAVKEGITSGTTAAAFSPNASCTRAQMVTFLWRANGSPKATGVNPFTDVRADAYYYDAVLWAAEQGITSGTTAATFSPDATLTRGQTVTFLWRANGSPAVSGGSFGDVASDAYYAGAVAWAVSEGVTSGTTAATFSPNANCTRAQIVTFMYRDAQ